MPKSMEFSDRAIEDPEDGDSRREQVITASVFISADFATLRRWKLNVLI